MGRAGHGRYVGALIVGALAVALGAASTARGDEPPPPLRKRVSFQFVIEGLDAHPEHVVFAYPWSGSDGAPTREHARVMSGRPVWVGSRSDQPRLYAMPRAAFEEWERTHEPTGEYGENPEADALVARPDVVRCTGRIRPRHRISSLSNADYIRQRLRVVSLNDRLCLLSELSTTRKRHGREDGGCSVSRDHSERFGVTALLLLVMAGTRRRRA